MRDLPMALTSAITGASSQLFIEVRSSKTPARERGGDFREHRARETLLGDGRENGRDVEAGGGAGDQGGVGAQQAGVDRLGREGHLRWKSIIDQGVIGRSEKAGAGTALAWGVMVLVLLKIGGPCPGPPRRCLMRGLCRRSSGS